MLWAAAWARLATPEHGDTAEALLRHADGEMYRAKSSRALVGAAKSA